MVKNIKKCIVKFRGKLKYTLIMMKCNYVHLSCLNVDHTAFV